MNDNNDIILKLNEAKRGGFYVMKNGFPIAEMEIAIQDSKLFVFHTEVSPELKGQNFGKKLMDEMVAYARKNNFIVMPYCPFVRAQFRRHPEEFADVWQK